ncbi:MAG: hypothetical protein JEY94_14840 [Melioribacteraceae bacterium]|nr:hypothetical protein [Melioribacteraceae bacterium]
MFGKGALLMIVGFSMIFLVFGHNFNNMATSSVINFDEFLVQSKAHQIAASGANFAANQVFMNSLWETGYSNLSFDGGTINVIISNPLINLATKTAICHSLPSNPQNKYTLYVPNADVAGYLAKGDQLGVCSTDPTGGSIGLITILSEGEYADKNSEVGILLRPSKFSKFAYFSNYEPSNIWWTNSDTVWGPFHVNGYIRSYRHPTYYGKVTCKNGLKYYTSSYKDKPNFYGGFEKGVDLPLPTDGVQKLEDAADASGVKFTGQDTVFLTFDKDSIKFRFHQNDKDSVVEAVSFSPNKVIFADNAVLRVKGSVSGQYSIGCSGNGYGGRGNIYLDDNITYDDDPRINTNSADLLGIIAQQNCYIADNAANSSGDIDIHASIFCEQGGFGSENYDSRPYGGDINLHGGIIQAVRRAVGTFGSYGTGTGFNKRYRYDQRLMLISPPHYPGTGQYEVVSWFE